MNLSDNNLTVIQLPLIQKIVATSVFVLLTTSV
ncbi:unknown [Bacteroides intestinalis CAG:564]|nr:unknown [Bacteroides intestinalis CAG:564]